MNRSRSLSFSACTLVLSTVSPAAEFRAKRVQDKNILEMSRIVASDELTSGEKIEKLRAYFEKTSNWATVLYYTARVDKAAAERIALEMFRAKSTPREKKHQLGSMIVQRYKTPGFLDEYCRFVIGAVLDGGLKEFLARRYEHEDCAIGEYAFMASDFWGYRDVDFAKLDDKRVISALTRALDAPDTLYAEDQGCVQRGKPGEPTGRNVARQQIPIALSKLGAKEAIPALRQKLLSHHDYWLRYHSAYALAVLVPRRDNRKLERKMNRDSELRQFLFPFGRGLIERGDADGIQYMAFKYSTYYKHTRASSALYMLNQRLPVLEGFKDPRTEEFYGEALNHPVLCNMFLFRAEKLHFGKLILDDRSAEEVLKGWSGSVITAYQRILEAISLNGLSDLHPLVEKIGARSGRPEIRRLSEEFMTRVKE